MTLLLLAMAALLLGAAASLFLGGSRRNDVSVVAAALVGVAAVLGLIPAIQVLAGADKPAVLRSVVEMLRLPDKVDREFLLQVLLAREALESTAIGDGIAIPHVRNPIVLHVPQPTMTLCFLEKPVDFGALDGRPVHTLFTFISPTVKAHLHLLSRLAFALRNPDFKALIVQQAGRDEILAAARKISDGLRVPVEATKKEAAK